jgi:hypothetical protein
MRPKRTEADYERLRLKAIELYRDGKTRSHICTKLAVSLSFINRSLIAAGLWNPDDDPPHDKPNANPTPAEIRRECLKIRAAKGRLRPEEEEELSRA